MEIDKLVGAYVACRDALGEERKNFKEIEGKYKSDLGVIEDAIMKLADDQGVESFKTEFGTAFKTRKDFISVENWDAALDYIVLNDLKHMLTKSVSKASAKEYMGVNGGKLPPGLKYGSIPVISIRRK